MRCTPDPTLRRLAPRVWSGGSPLRLFRVTDRGDVLVAGLLDGSAPAPLDPGARRLFARLISAGAAHPVADPTEAEMTLRELAVVIPVHNDPERVSSFRLDRASSLGRVLVVDDGSADPVAHKAAADSIGADYMRLPLNGGPAAARNSGVRTLMAESKQTRLVAFLDADTVVSIESLEGLLAYFNDQHLGAVAPRIRSVIPDSGSSSLLAEYEVSHSPLDMGSAPAIVRPGSPVSYVPSAALVVRTAAFNEIGGFDEGLRFGEDVDLVWRLSDGGWTVRYDPRSEVGHFPRSNWRGWLKQRIDYGSAATPLDQRHEGVVSPARLSGWSAGVWGCVALGQPIAGAAMAAWSSWSLAQKLEDIPRATAVSLALRGHGGAGRQLARSAMREWWPVLAAGSLVSKRARKIALGCIAVNLATEVGPFKLRMLATLDNVAYGAGVWTGAISGKSINALKPKFPKFP